MALKSKKNLSAQAKMTSGTWPENGPHDAETKSQGFIIPKKFFGLKLIVNNFQKVCQNWRFLAILVD